MSVCNICLKTGISFAIVGITWVRCVFGCRYLSSFHCFTERKNGIEDKPYMFGFISDILSEHLTQVKRQLSLVRLFMLLSLLLSVLGLIAMSRFYADEHSKDIAIRKVFGSTMETEIRKTVLEYLLLLGVAALIAVPIAVWLASKLLEQYSYRITGYGWVFAVAVLLATVVAFLSILWQTLKAARTNPAVELKKE